MSLLKKTLNKTVNTTGHKNVVCRLSKTELPKDQSSKKQQLKTCYVSLTSNKQLQ